MKSWQDKLNSDKPSQKKLLEKTVAGMQAGSMMYISTPLEIDAYIRQIPHGQSVSVKQMRDDLAEQNDADCTCPMTTGIFLRVVSEAAFEDMNQDEGEGEGVTPFWRVVEPKSTTAKKLSFGAELIEQKRAEENIEN